MDRNYETLREDLGSSCRGPHGSRGSKPISRLSSGSHTRRGPHGSRGSKLALAVDLGRDLASRPARVAWIETQSYIQSRSGEMVAARTGRVDRNDYERWASEIPAGRGPHGSRGSKHV
ncbi:hypothetical protein T31B1_06785 [Salinisphaera sp. T31B1]